MRMHLEFSEACDIMKAMDPSGKGRLLDGCEFVKELISGYECWEEAPISFKEMTAFRVVCREMSKLFR